MFGLVIVGGIVRLCELGLNVYCSFELYYLKFELVSLKLECLELLVYVEL